MGSCSKQEQNGNGRSSRSKRNQEYFSPSSVEIDNLRRMDYLTRTERRDWQTIQPSRDKRLILFLSTPSRAGKAFVPTYSNFVSKTDAEEDSDVEDGLPGQFDDPVGPPNGVIVKEVKGRYEDSLTLLESSLRGQTKVMVIPVEANNQKSVESVGTTFQCDTCARFRHPDLLRQLATILPSSFYALIKTITQIIPVQVQVDPTNTSAEKRIIPIPEQFADNESDPSENENKTRNEGYEVPLPFRPPVNHSYYLALTKVYRQSVVNIPFVPFKNLGSLHVTKEDHLFLTSNRFAYNISAMGSFWCIRNPLGGMKGCQIDDYEYDGSEINNNIKFKSKIKSWKLNHPNLDISGTNVSTGRYPVPLTAAVPMNNRMIFFGDEGGRVGVAWYYFLDEMDKYSYKISQENNEWSRRHGAGCFQVIATDKKAITNHNSKISAIDVFSHDGRTGVSGGMNGSVFLWSADVLLVKCRFPKIARSGGAITSIKCSPNDLDCFATASKSGSVLLWDIRCLKPFEIAYRLENQHFRCMGWHPDNPNCILGGSSTGDVITFDIRFPMNWRSLIRPWGESKSKEPISHLEFNPQNHQQFALSSESHIAHFEGLHSSSCKSMHRYDMKSQVSGVAFYRDKIFSVDDDCYLTGFKLN